MTIATIAGTAKTSRATGASSLMESPALLTPTHILTSVATSQSRRKHLIVVATTVAAPPPIKRPRSRHTPRSKQPPKITFSVCIQKFSPQSARPSSRSTALPPSVSPISASDTRDRVESAHQYRLHKVHCYGNKLLGRNVVRGVYPLFRRAVNRPACRGGDQFLGYAALRRMRTKSV